MRESFDFLSDTLQTLLLSQVHHVPCTPIESIRVHERLSATGCYTTFPTHSSLAPVLADIPARVRRSLDRRRDCRAVRVAGSPGPNLSPTSRRPVGLRRPLAEWRAECVRCHLHDDDGRVLGLDHNAAILRAARLVVGNANRRYHLRTREASGRLECTRKAKRVGAGPSVGKMEGIQSVEVPPGASREAHMDASGGWQSDPIAVDSMSAKSEFVRPFI